MCALNFLQGRGIILHGVVAKGFLCRNTGAQLLNREQRTPVGGAETIVFQRTTNRRSDMYARLLVLESYIRAIANRSPLSTTGRTMMTGTWLISGLSVRDSGIRGFVVVIAKHGLLPTDKIVETSGLDFTGDYVEQTKTKVIEFLREAKGGVLFIDEAYNLGTGAFGKEAGDSLLFQTVLRARVWRAVYASIANGRGSDAGSLTLPSPQRVHDKIFLRVQE